MSLYRLLVEHQKHLNLLPRDKGLDISSYIKRLLLCNEHKQHPSNPCIVNLEDIFVEIMYRLQAKVQLLQVEPSERSINSRASVGWLEAVTW